MTEREQARAAARRLAIIRHTQEVTGLPAQRYLEWKATPSRVR